MRHDRCCLSGRKLAAVQERRLRRLRKARREWRRQFEATCAPLAVCQCLARSSVRPTSSEKSTTIASSQEGEDRSAEIRSPYQLIEMYYVEIVRNGLLFIVLDGRDKTWLRFFQVTRERRFNMRKNTPAQPVATEAKFKFSSPSTFSEVVC